MARLAFRHLGTDRIVRYLIAIASFLAAATVADSFGIEGIVGAFFAGLALNRLVPNEGPLMERIDFFGAPSSSRSSSSRSACCSTPR